MMKALETRIARLEARSADTRASLPWISIIAEEAKAR
jgi:BMFP domain-containing protein YqiC